MTDVTDAAERSLQLCAAWMIRLRLLVLAGMNSAEEGSQLELPQQLAWLG